MERNIRETSIVNDSDTLENKEGCAVNFKGELAKNPGEAMVGVVTRGRPQHMASVVAYEGQIDACVNGQGSSIAIGDPLTVGGGTHNDGYLIKNEGFGSSMVNAYAMEGTSSATKIKISIA